MLIGMIRSQSTRAYACLTALLWVGCSSGPELPNVVLISVDSLRPDHLSINGYSRETDAPLKELFQHAVVFENAISTSSWTAPAVASLITGQLPRQHGVTKGRVKVAKGDHPTEAELQPVLDPSIITLAEYLEARGYATLAVSTNPHITRELGFAQGFRHFERVQPVDAEGATGSLHADAARANAVATRLRNQVGSRQPVFLWIHYIDTHLPYYARQPWLDEYKAELRLPAVELPASAAADTSFRGKAMDLSQKRRLLEAYYDSEVAYAMQQISELLKELALGDDTVFVLTSDHGEAFFEHGYMGHSVYLYESEIRIPLLIRFPEPGPDARRVPEFVSIVDVMPTLLDFLGIPVESPIQGRSLLALADGATDPEPVALFGSLSRRKKKSYSFVQRGRYKLIRNHYTGHDRLIDFQTDRIEFRDSSKKNKEVVKELSALLEDPLSARPHETEPGS